MNSTTHVAWGTSHVENSLGELCIFWNEEQRMLNKPQVTLILDQCMLYMIQSTQHLIQCTLYMIQSIVYLMSALYNIWNYSPTAISLIPTVTNSKKAINRHLQHQKKREKPWANFAIFISHYFSHSHLIPTLATFICYYSWVGLSI